MRRGVSAAIVVLVIAAGPWSPARAGGTPAQKCAQSKLKATGKKASAKLKCDQKAIASGVAVDAECLAKAEDKFLVAFQKAETKGECATVGDAAAVEGDVDTFVAATAAALPGGATDAGRKCAASKLDAAGKKANAKLRCHATAAGAGLAVDPSCLGKAEAKFVRRSRGPPFDSVALLKRTLRNPSGLARWWPDRGSAFRARSFHVPGGTRWSEGGHAPCTTPNTATTPTEVNGLTWPACTPAVHENPTCGFGPDGSALLSITWPGRVSHERRQDRGQGQGARPRRWVRRHPDRGQLPVRRDRRPLRRGDLHAALRVVMGGLHGN